MANQVYQQLRRSGVTARKLDLAAEALPGPLEKGTFQNYVQALTTSGLNVRESTFAGPQIAIIVADLHGNRDALGECVVKVSAVSQSCALAMEGVVGDFDDPVHSKIADRVKQCLGKSLHTPSLAEHVANAFGPVPLAKLPPFIFGCEKLDLEQAAHSTILLSCIAAGERAISEIDQRGFAITYEAGDFVPYYETLTAAVRDLESRDPTFPEVPKTQLLDPAVGFFCHGFVRDQRSELEKFVLQVDRIFNRTYGPTRNTLLATGLVEKMTADNHDVCIAVVGASHTFPVTQWESDLTGSYLSLQQCLEARGVSTIVIDLPLDDQWEQFADHLNHFSGQPVIFSQPHSAITEV